MQHSVLPLPPCSCYATYVAPFPPNQTPTHMQSGGMRRSRARSMAQTGGMGSPGLRAGGHSQGQILGSGQAHGPAWMLAGEHKRRGSGSQYGLGRGISAPLDGAPSVGSEEGPHTGGVGHQGNREGPGVPKGQDPFAHLMLPHAAAIRASALDAPAYGATKYKARIPSVHAAWSVCCSLCLAMQPQSPPGITAPPPHHHIAPDSEHRLLAKCFCRSATRASASSTCSGLGRLWQLRLGQARLQQSR